MPIRLYEVFQIEPRLLRPYICVDLSHLNFQGQEMEIPLSLNGIHPYYYVHSHSDFPLKRLNDRRFILNFNFQQ